MAGKDRGKMVFNDAVIFDLILVVFFLTLAIVALDYNPRARAVPFALGLLGAFMMLLQLLADAVPGIGAVLRFIRKENMFEKEGSAKDERDRVQGEKGESRCEKTGGMYVWWQVTRLVVWLVAFVLLLALTNYLVATAAFILVVTKLEAGESWKKSILLSLCVSAGFFVLFQVLLKTQF
jgi:uncharacterized Tic20 family protein